MSRIRTARIRRAEGDDVGSDDRPPDGVHDEQESAKTPGHMRLGEWLVSRGDATVGDVDSALAEQRLTGDPLGQLLLARGVIDEDELARALAQVVHLPFRDLRASPPDAAVVGRLPEAFCRKRTVLPVAVEDGRLIVAVGDPHDVLTLDDAQVVAGCPVEAVISPGAQLRRAIEAAFAPPGEARAPVDGPRSTATDEAALNDLRVASFADRLLDRAVAQRASDVHLEPAGGGMRIRMRVDGVLRDAVDLGSSAPTGTTNRFKILAGLDIAEHRRPQDGRMSFVAAGRTVDARVATLPTVHGEAVTVRILDRTKGLLDINDLGFDVDALADLRHAYGLPWGLILAVGPTGSGKSTTIYSIVNEINDPRRNVITVEDPVEYEIAGIKQTQVHNRIGYTFAAGLRSILRSDPDVIVIGEIRDSETAHTAAEAALTGHLVLSTLHANDASSAAARLLEMDIEPYLVASSLTCVVAQRLVRRLCPQCRVPYQPGEDELLAIAALRSTARSPGPARGGVVHPSHPDDPDGGDAPGGTGSAATGELGDVTDEPRRAAAGDTDRVSGGTGPAAPSAPPTLFHPRGCRACEQTGYHGRVAVYEVMPMTPHLRALALAQASAAEIHAAASGDGMQSLRENGVAKVVAGVTTFDELARCIV